jgi:hypothetical protein
MWVLAPSVSSNINDEVRDTVAWTDADTASSLVIQIQTQ